MAPPHPRRAAVAGLGAAGGFVLRALESLDGVRVVAGADPRGDEAASAAAVSGPVVRDLRALAAHGPLDLLVVTAPTREHEAVVQAGLDLRVPQIWVDKPRTGDLSSYDRLAGAARGAGVQLRTLLHRAFAVEVLQAARLLPGWRESHGAVAAVEACFRDPYARAPDRQATLGSPWLDSGINALSVLARLDLLPEDVTRAASDDPLRAVVEFPTGRIRCLWTAAGADKQTSLRFADGATATIDHTGWTVTERPISGPPRVQRCPEQSLPDRYAAMLRAYVSGDESILSPAEDRRLHGLLFAAEALLRAPES